MLNLEANLRLESIYLGITSRSYYYLPPLAFNYFQLFIIARDISLSLSLSRARARSLSPSIGSTGSFTFLASSRGQI